MLRKLDDGLLIDVSTIARIQGTISSDHERHMPYVVIEKRDGGEIHVHAASEPLADRAAALAIAKAKAEAFIQIVIQPQAPA